MKSTKQQNISTFRIASTYIGAEYEVPMVYISGRFIPWIRLIYSSILLAEIYTTAVGNLYGFVARLTDPDGPRYRLYVISSSI